MNRIPYFDAHCDTLYDVNRAGYLYENAGHLDGKRLHENFRCAVQFFAVCQNLRRLPAEGPVRLFERYAELLTREISLHADCMTQCRNGEEARRANAEGKVAAFLTCEGSELLGCDPDRLDWASSVGVKAINLTWNHENFLCGSNASAPDRGLNDYGKAFVRRAQELDILIDVSHCSDAAFWDLIDVTEKPIIASHSDSRALCPHRRNLTDDMFRAICETGGVVGVNFWSDLLAEGRRATIDDLVRHIDRFMELGGEKHVGLGADFDGCSPLPVGISGVQDECKLWEALAAHGYGEDLLEDIFYGNFMRVI